MFGRKAFPLQFSAFISLFIDPTQNSLLLTSSSVVIETIAIHKYSKWLQLHWMARDQDGLWWGNTLNRYICRQQLMARRSIRSLNNATCATFFFMLKKSQNGYLLKLLFIWCILSSETRKPGGSLFSLNKSM